MRKSLRILVGFLLTAGPALLRDLSGLAGAALCAYGAWLISPPWGYITGGALLVIGAWLAARNAG